MPGKLISVKRDFLKWAKKMLGKEDYKAAVAFAEREFKRRRAVLKKHRETIKIK